MDKIKIRRRVFALKLSAVGLNVFSALWLCVYTFLFFPKTMQTQPGSVVGVFAVALANGLAVAVVLSVILLASAAAVLFVGCGCIFICKERQYSPLGGKNVRSRFHVCRIVGDVLLAAAGIILLVFGSSLGTASFLPMFASLIAALAGIGTTAAAEILQSLALKRTERRTEE